MFEVRKWECKPILKEVIGTFEDEEKTVKFLKDLMVRNAFTVDELNENFEVENMDKGEILQLIGV